MQAAPGQGRRHGLRPPPGTSSGGSCRQWHEHVKCRSIMVDGAHREGQDRRNAALVEAFRVLAAVREQLLAAVKEQLNGQGPDAGAALGSLVADCQAPLDLTPNGGDADVGVPRPRA